MLVFIRGEYADNRTSTLEEIRKVVEYRERRIKAIVYRKRKHFGRLIFHTEDVDGLYSYFRGSDNISANEEHYHYRWISSFLEKGL